MSETTTGLTNYAFDFVVDPNGQVGLRLHIKGCTVTAYRQQIDALLRSQTVIFETSQTPTGQISFSLADLAEIDRRAWTNILSLKRPYLSKEAHPMNHDAIMSSIIVVLFIIIGAGAVIARRRYWRNG